MQRFIGGGRLSWRVPAVPSDGEDWLTRWSRYLARFGGLLILFATVPITLDVLLRNSVGITAFESFELTGYAFAIAVAFGYGYALLGKTHIRIDVLQSRMPQPLRGMLDLLAHLGLTLVVAMFAWYAWSTVMESWRYKAISPNTLGTPLVIPQSIWSLGWTWFALVCLVLLVRSVRALARRDARDFQRLLGGTVDAADAERAAEDGR